MSYALKESFLTLQGEGAQAGRLSVFLRFSGCNYWSGREADRSKATADCGRWCDTEFVGTDGDGGGRFSLDSLLERVQQLWGSAALASGQPSQASGPPYVVLTGGEPGLQVDAALVQGLHGIGAVIAIETNGSCELPPGIDWICVSPKRTTLGLANGLKTRRGQELKIVLPQPDLAPGTPLGQELLDFAAGFEHRFVQPRDNAAMISAEASADSSLEACLRWIHHHPDWRLSSQTHKLIGLR